MKKIIPFLLILFTFIQCTKLPEPPIGVGNVVQVSTTAITAITGITAVSGGTITTDGGNQIDKRGVCWSTNTAPTIKDAISSDGFGSGGFTSNITGLKKNTKYYIRAYATNAVGTFYGNELNLTTLSTVSSITTTALTGVTQTTAALGGNITDDGGAPITLRGICYSSTNKVPTILDSKTADGTGTGIFSSALSTLLPLTTYYACAYATNSVGTAYGNVISFATLTNLPGLTTNTVGSIDCSSGIGGGNVISDGGSPITSRGVCWSNTNANPTVLDSRTVSGTGLGAFTSNIVSLIAGFTYYVRAYATNANGTTYGNMVSFMALPSSVPNIITTSISGIGQFSALSGGSIVTDGCSNILQKGVVWSTSSNPTISSNTGLTSDGSGNSNFSSSIVGLLAGTTYYFRAYASNSIGTAYGTQYSFTTSPAILATINTVSVSVIGINSSVSGGTISSDGGGAITSKGVCWSTSNNPTITSNIGMTNNGTGISTFSSSVTGLNSGTTYFVRAYATNSAGTAYGTSISFTTATINIPTISTLNATSITKNTCSSGGTISSDGGAAITAKGVCWSTSANPTITSNLGITNDGSGVANFNSSVTGLNAGTTYFIRAYATNSAGTAYGSSISFTTTAASLPIVTTQSISSISNTSAISGGLISSDGGSPILAKGICWNSATGPTITNRAGMTNDGSGSASYPSSLTSLVAGTIYYVRAYATNSVGTSYGNEYSFTAITLLAPTLTTYGKSPSYAVINWSAVTGATSYQFQICKNNTFTGTTYNLSSCGFPSISGVNSASGIIATSYCVGLSPGTWYCRVSASNSQTTSSWSAIGTVIL